MNNLLFLHINVQSLKNKLDELQYWLELSKCSILSINEHWLKDSEIELCIPSNYILVGKFCRSKKEHGGSAIYIRKELELEAINIDSRLDGICAEEVFEATAIQLPHYNIIAVSVYRTPSSDEKLFVDKLIQLVTLFNKSKYKNNKIFIFGDINIDIRIKRKLVAELVDNLRSLNFYCLNDKPTRKEACLDNVISNVHINNVEINVKNLALSDHDSLWLKIPITPVKDKYNYIYRPLNEKRLEDLRVKLSLVNWYNYLNVQTDSNSLCNSVLNKLVSEYESCCPRIVKKQNRPRRTKNVINKWFTSELDSIRKMLLMYSKKSKEDASYKETYIKMRKVYKNKIKLAKCHSNEKYILNSHNPCKAAWKVIKNEINKPTNNNQIPIAPEKFNNHFTNVKIDSQHKSFQIINTLDALDILQQNVEKVNTKLSWSLITENDVCQAISKLSNSKAEDCYGLSNYVIKYISKEISFPLAVIINRLFNTGVFPDCLKITVTVPIYKKGNKSDPNNYRPISLIPIVSKIVEICIHKQIVTYFETNNLLTTAQFGFRSKLSTVKAIENIVSNIYEGFENKIISCATLLDLSKAFDMVPHNILIEKLKYYGMELNSLNLVSSYLNNRFQMVKINNCKSNLMRIKKGVPQGSVLGPLLFIIYTNDLPQFLPSKTIMYADDTTILNSDKSLDSLKEKNEIVLCESAKWFNANLLLLNSEKTEEIIFNLNVLNTENRSVKLLGVHIDQKLCWNIQIEHLCNKLSRVIFLLYKLRHSVSCTLMLYSYYAFFHSHLTYGILLWGNSTDSNLVFKWQKKALRCVLNLKSNESCKEHFKRLGIITVPGLYVYNCLMYVKENLIKFQPRSNVHSHNTRHNHQIDLPFSKLTKVHKSYRYMSLDLFNHLPYSAHNATLNRFKTVLNQWLKGKALYSVMEFKETNISDLKF
jgi:hypothetical protein